jgi:hypothetical protein
MKTSFVLNLVLGLFLSTVLSGCIHSTSKERGIASLPRHVIIGVHGIGGSAETWGELENPKDPSSPVTMGLALEKHLREINPNYEHKFYNFTYKASKEYKNTFEYAEGRLSDFIDDIFKDREIQPEDKISFVAHSQGGLVTMIWYVDSLVTDALNQEGQYRKDLKRFAKYARQVDSITTVGTPFWGSKLATRFSDPANVNLPMVLGMFNPHEMHDMAFNSNTVYKFRRSTIALSKRPELKKLFTAKLVNIAGIFPKDQNKLYYKHVHNDKSFMTKATRFILDTLRSFFFDVGFGGDRYESDVAVLAPSSRLGFMYADDLDDGSRAEITGESFKEADFFDGSKWILTESLHSPISPAHNVGMAYLPKYCMDIKACDHPTYRYILNSVANCDGMKNCNTAVLNQINEDQNALNAEDNKINAGLQSKLQGYEVEMVLRLPGREYDLEDPRFKKTWKDVGVNYYDHHPNGDNPGDPAAWKFSQKKFYTRSVGLNTNKEGMLKKAANPLVDVFIGEDIEPISKIASFKDILFRDSEHTDIRLHLTGYVRPSEEGKKNMAAYNAAVEKGIDVPVVIDLPGLKKRNMVVRVKPAYSTFVEAQLDYQDEYKRQ